MKKLFKLLAVLALAAAGSAFANGGFEPPSTGDSGTQQPMEPPDQVREQAEQSSFGFKFDACTPNPFALCSLPRPPKKDPRRKCWDKVCP